MKNVFTTCLFVACCGLFFSSQAQAPFSFTNANNRLGSSTYHSGNSVSVVDMDGDGRDDIAVLNNSNDLYYVLQKTGDNFNSIHGGGTGSTGSAWAMVVGDVNSDGVRDVSVGFGSNAYLIKPNTTLTNFSLSGALPKPSVFFPQNMNFSDIDNDGLIDLFICNDNAGSVMYKNVAGTYPSTTNFFDVSNPGSDNSGNYGSIFTDVDNDGDLDLYIAHCRQSTGSTDSRRLDQLFINNGNGSYTLDAAAVPGARGLRNYGMTWTASFEDIDNDGDFDCLLTQTDVASQLFLNNGNGYFTDITAGSGLVVNVTPYQSKMEDLDNDGFVDIIISGDDSRVFHNNHNNTFTLVNNLFDNNNMLSFAIGDLNHDGKIDLYSTYGNVYNSPSNTADVLWLNTTDNGNHFITLNLEGTVSNRDALGARVDVYGAWGRQTREVRAGESYGTTNTFMCHFGLGTATTVDSITIHWPSGIVTHIGSRPADQFISVKESVCVSANNIIGFSGPSVLCQGQSVTMSAAPGYSYLWNTGDTTQSITTSATGEYSVRVKDDATGCFSVSKTVTIVSQPDETPSIAAAGPLTFCEGASVVLQGSAAASYLWSNGDTTQSTTVTEPGSYSLTIQGVCAAFTSSPIVVSPIPSHISNVTPAAVCEGNSTPLTLGATATGTTYWYNSDTASASIATGTSYTTPAITQTTTYYVESRDTVFGISGTVGPVDNTYGNGGNYNTAQYQVFDVAKACVLKSVKVYASAAGNRTVELRNSTGTLLQSATVNVPSGEFTIPLNFDLTPGTAYRLGISGTINLYRNSSNSTYPYTLANLVTVTGNSVNNLAYWYFYYNWQVAEEPVACASTRTAVTATVNPNPTASFTGLNTTYIETDGAVSLTGIPAGGTFSGTGVSGNSFDPATAGVGGPYTVSYAYTDGNGCSDSYDLSVTVLQDTSSSVGLNQIAEISAVSIYPNPNNGQFNLTLRSSVAQTIDVAITDAIGQKVFEEKNMIANNDFNKAINLKSVAKGYYNLVITSNKKQNTYKLVIQ